MVSGSAIYRVAVKVTPVSKPRWSAVCKDCSGAIDSLIELLQGRFSKGVMERICRHETGLFPSPGEIRLSCSCPDWATMCKHVAAVLYGIGARLDEQPELLFRLRKVNETDLIASAGAGFRPTKKGPAAGRVLDGSDLAEVFGLEMAEGAQPEPEKRNRGTKSKRAKTPATGRVPVSKSGRPDQRRANAPAKKERTPKR